MLSPISCRPQRLALVQATALAGFVVALSFMPPEWKHLLKTRGPMHFWAHLYAFLALCVLFLRGFRRSGFRVAAVVGLGLLGFAIEAFQARQQVAAFEAQDLVCDLLGVAAGVVIAFLRSASPSAAGALLRDGVRFGP